MSADPRDVVEDGQAECHKCGEWYHTTAPFIPHRCQHEERMADEDATSDENISPVNDGPDAPYPFNLTE
jgi:hypothetical protein